MRDSGANQTINQVNIFGTYTRWAVDVPPPDHTVPVRGLLTTVGAAVRFATGTPAGPVHLNCQFREPLAPKVAEWPQSLLKVASVDNLVLHYSCSFSPALLLLFFSCSPLPLLLPSSCLPPACPPPGSWPPPVPLLPSPCSPYALLTTALAPILAPSCPPFPLQSCPPPWSPPAPLPAPYCLSSDRLHATERCDHLSGVWMLPPAVATYSAG